MISMSGNDPFWDDIRREIYVGFRCIHNYFSILFVDFVIYFII